jgi:hydroxymethylpyrimidine pyrophosphatase-like HAD family hydrolase
VAVGDAANDLPLLAVAGTAIAMGQAAPEIIAASHLVAPGVDAYGAAVALDAAAAGWR